MTILTIAHNKAIQLGAIVVLSLISGAYLHKRFTPPTTTTTVVHDVQQVYVDVPVITEKIVDRIITDPVQQAAIKKVTQENASLKLQITQLSSTVATNNTSGGTGAQGNAGTITNNPFPTVNPTNTAGSAAGQEADRTFHYADWQLTADYSALKFTYGLQQTFIVESTIGTDSNGKSVGLTRLFQESPNGLLPIPAKTTVVQADPNPSKWFISPRIQGGLGVDQDKVKSGFVGLQLFKHGTSKDPKDLAFAVGTVGVSISSGKAVTPLLLPVSVNLGHLPKQPFSNLWVSPGIDINHKLSVLLTATF